MRPLPPTARGDFGVALGALAVLVGWELSGLDLAVSGWFGTGRGFPWRDAWLTSTVLHDGGRALAWLVLGGMALDAVCLLWRGPTRAERLRWLGVTVACLLLVPALKRASASSCPWDLATYGGLAPYVPHWRLNHVDGGPGHCFPSGHAVAAFAFFSGYFLWRGERPTAARRGLVTVCLMGCLFGAAQVLRGAHFVSHVLWAAWLCWVTCSMVDLIARSRVAPTVARRRSVLRMSANSQSSFGDP